MNLAPERACVRGLFCIRSAKTTEKSLKPLVFPERDGIVHSHKLNCRSSATFSVWGEKFPLNRVLTVVAGAIPVTHIRIAFAAVLNATRSTRNVE